MSIHTRSAVGAIRRSPFQAISAIFVLSLTFFVATLFATLFYASGRLLNYFETRPQVIAFIKNDAVEIDIANLQHKLEADSRIREVKYVNKETALSIYKKATSNNPQLGELVSTSIFPASLEFSVKDLAFTKDILDEVKKEKIIESVGFTASIGDENSLNTVVSKLKDITSYLRIGGIIFTGILAFVSFIVLLAIISMRLSSRKDEIEILRLIGATQKFVRSPIISEAIIYVQIGIIMGSLTAFIVVLYLTPSISRFFGEITILPKGFLEVGKLFLILLMIEEFMGMLIAYLGSYLAVSRAKKIR